MAALGPYLSERQWGTVREDYSADGTAWDHFPHGPSTAGKAAAGFKIGNRHPRTFHDRLQP